MRDHLTKPANNVTLIPYVAAITLSSFLLFLIQPLSAKAMLPLYGGVPAVWNTCMMFFQGMLLAGYFYTYLITRYLSVTSQRLCHLVLIAASALMLPITWNALLVPANLHPILYVIALLFSKISLPLFVISTTAPLVQNWFGRTSHPDASDPYFLYSASNIGSLLALFSFPLLLEPFIGRQLLSYLWSVAYGVFALLIMSIAVKQCNQPVNIIAALSSTEREKICWVQRGHWLLLSFAPSSLLLAVTQYITTNIASTPLLWILPLTLYLLTFIIVFARKPLISHQWMVREMPYFLIFPLITLTQFTHAAPAWQLIVFHLMGFFALAMACHGELAIRRPDKSRLTEFYLWMSLGGFLGGIFNSLIAPLVFHGIYEYYIALCICVLLCPAAIKDNNKQLGFRLPLIIIVILFGTYLLHQHYSQIHYTKQLFAVIELAVITMIILNHQRPKIFALNLAIIFIYAQATARSSYGELIWQSRNFFGVSQVYNDKRLNLHIYIDGVTLHGAQLYPDTSGSKTALTYYQPVDRIANFLSKSFSTDKTVHVAIAGLGAGTISCMFRHDVVTFYEINPTVIKIATNPTMFTYLLNCPPKGGIIAGDARYNINHAPEHYYNIILLDAFSSDVIPAHLLTIDAMNVYLHKLKYNGVLIFNITNTYADLKPLLAAMAKQLHLIALEFDHLPGTPFEYHSNWVVLTKNMAVAEGLHQRFDWKKMIDTESALVWTDDYSNILRVLK